MRSRLLVTQRVDRIELGGFTRGIKSEKDTDPGADHERENDRRRRNERRPVFQNRDDLRRDDARDDPDYSPDNTERHRFDQKLSEDVAPVRAYRHARPNLAGPLRDANEHDVHNPDPANDERND